MTTQSNNPNYYLHCRPAFNPALGYKYFVKGITPLALRIQTPEYCQKWDSLLIDLVNGMTFDEASAKYGVTVGGIQKQIKKCHKFGSPFPILPARNKINKADIIPEQYIKDSRGFAILKPELAEQWADLHAQGMSYENIGKRYSVATMSVWRALNRKQHQPKG